MAINGINNIATQEISKEPNTASAESKTTGETAETQDAEAPDTVKTIVQETENAKETPARGDSYISSEKELKDASGLYSVSRKSEGGMEIKFDDIQLQKKRNDIKSELTRLKSSNIPEDKEKAAELSKKLAAIEKKIRMQKQR